MRFTGVVPGTGEMVAPCDRSCASCGSNSRLSLVGADVGTDRRSICKGRAMVERRDEGAAHA
jgi:hypothetical protein